MCCKRGCKRVRKRCLSDYNANVFTKRRQSISVYDWNSQ